MAAPPDAGVPVMAFEIEDGGVDSGAALVAEASMAAAVEEIDDAEVESAMSSGSGMRATRPRGTRRPPRMTETTTEVVAPPTMMDGLVGEFTTEFD